jgi:hypothetical protein
MNRKNQAQILFIFGALLVSVLKLTQEKILKNFRYRFATNQHFSKNKNVNLNPCEHIKKSSAKAPEPQLWLYFECCSQKA